MKKALSDFSIFTKFWVFKITFFSKIIIQPLLNRKKSKFLTFFKNLIFSAFFKISPKIWPILKNFLQKNVGFCPFLHHFCTRLADANFFLLKNGVKSAFFENNFIFYFLTFFRAPKQKKSSKK